MLQFVLAGRPGDVHSRPVIHLVRMSVFPAWRDRAAATVLCLALAGCGGNPATPTPPGPPALTCPADIEATADDGVSSAVTYSLPPVQGGTPPLTLACSPATGFAFPVGSSTVTCTVTDADGRAATCQFRVRVVSGLGLSRTSFLAFGDSITEGKIATTWNALTLVGPGFSYPAQLLQVLTERYPAENIVVVNEGVGGETTNGGLERLPDTLGQHPTADVMLLLEGVNAINVIPEDRQLSNLRAMIRMAQDAGLDVLIATLTPISDERADRSPTMPQRIRDLNAGIRSLAVQEGIGPAVDLYGAFEGRPSLLSADGLHPSEEGYRVIAETFADEIEQRWETTGGGSQSALSRAGPPWKR